MGVLKRLNIFRKANKASSAVEPFQPAADEEDDQLHGEETPTRQLEEAEEHQEEDDEIEFVHEERTEPLAPQPTATAAPEIDPTSPLSLASLTSRKSRSLRATPSGLLKALRGTPKASSKESPVAAPSPAAAASAQAEPKVQEDSPRPAPTPAPPLQPLVQAAPPPRTGSPLGEVEPVAPPAEETPSSCSSQRRRAAARPPPLSSLREAEEDPCEHSIEAIQEVTPKPAAAQEVTPKPAAAPAAEPAEAPAAEDAEEPPPRVLAPACPSPKALAPGGGRGSRKSFQDSGPLPKMKAAKPRTGLQLQGLVVRGRSFKCMQEEVQLPGALNEEEQQDEFIMDSILEETGAVFGGSTLFNNQEELMRSTASKRFGGFSEETPVGTGSGPLGQGVGISMSASSQYFSELSQIEAEHYRLEEELMNMGLDLETWDEHQAALEEQQALLCSYQQQPATSQSKSKVDADEEVAVLLDSLQGDLCDLSLNSLQSIEAC